ncbi:2-hydroxyacylsphingosine 1-beta-galactosyltransferase-like [Haliotis rubra]|uniref:2-hydroxyacylsphingosine 1-beta-galactosyltransferase-like n=1 Tax=Haliotis rubra TaxID=36100 RepID=UPI001EE598F6|nr:2-hydroxyacylsphingosine 1-beta-galactosyltransferase-like [Haliotis rubra]XP_046585157.1 2-hydroxyacylsphingosine 1-beta-galactosyltransferase-like [Haliotis rubra]
MLQTSTRLAVILLLLVCPNCLDGANILMFPGPFSHFGVMSHIAKELSREGHKITFITYKAQWVKKADHFDLWTYSDDNSDYEKVMEELFADSLAGRSQYEGDKITRGQAAVDKQMRDFFESVPKFRASAEKEKFDLAVADAFIVHGMHFIKSLNLPLIVFACGAFDAVQHARLSQTPSPLAYVPVGFTPLQLTDRMSFLDRLTNTGLYVANQLALKYYFATMNQYARNSLPEVQHLSYEDIMADAELWLANTDFTLEFPRPLTPNVVYVGGLTTKDSQPLPQDLESFLAGSGDAGVIVFSLGTTVKDLDAATAQAFVDAFKSLPQRVIWRYGGTKVPPVPDNVRIMKWIPQNDLLGHPKVRLFLNHGGISGVMEAIYHGIPMVAIPIFGDQFDIVARIVAKGMGLRIDVTNITKASILSSVQQVLGDRRFYDTSKKMSAIMKSREQHPMRRTVYWINYILDHGGQHLRPASRDLNFLQYFLLDVITCIVGVVVVFLWVLKCLCCCGLRCCCRKRNTKPKLE